MLSYFSSEKNLILWHLWYFLLFNGALYSVKKIIAIGKTPIHNYRVLYRVNMLS